MGSKSKSSSATTTSNVNKETTISKADYSTGAGNKTDNNVTGNSNVTTIQTTDFGAIEGGLALSKDSLTGAFDFGKKALDSVDSSTDRTMKAITGLSAAQERSNAETMTKVLAIQEQRTTDGSAQMTKLILGLGLTVAAVMAFMAYQNRGAA